MTLTRRAMLRTSASTIGLFGAARAFGRSDDLCFRTPEQPEGPFYPIAEQLDTNNDLTLVHGRRQRAKGEVIFVQGIVQDESCKPVPNAVVEIWQACATGRYNHPGDRENTSPLDPNFQYWGITTTNEHGQYIFKTIEPGHYKASPTWMRPPHIHFKVHRLGFHELITQMYFEGNQFNSGDLILNGIDPAQRQTVVIQKRIRETGEHDYFFDITLVKVS